MLLLQSMLLVIIFPLPLLSLLLLPRSLLLPLPNCYRCCCCHCRCCCWCWCCCYHSRCCCCCCCFCCCDKFIRCHRHRIVRRSEQAIIIRRYFRKSLHLSCRQRSLRYSLFAIGAVMSLIRTVLRVRRHSSSALDVQSHYATRCSDVAALPDAIHDEATRRDAMRPNHHTHATRCSDSAIWHDLQRGKAATQRDTTRRDLIIIHTRRIVATALPDATHGKATLRDATRPNHHTHTRVAATSLLDATHDEATLSDATRRDATRLSYTHVL